MHIINTKLRFYKLYIRCSKKIILSLLYIMKLKKSIESLYINKKLLVKNQKYIVSNPPIFNYISFCKRLSVHVICFITQSWYSNAGYIKKKFHVDDNSYFLSKRLHNFILGFHRILVIWSKLDSDNPKNYLTIQ